MCDTCTIGAQVRMMYNKCYFEAARYISAESKLGSLEPGKYADIIVLAEIRWLISKA